MDLGTRITAWLRVRGITQKELARRVGVTPGAVTAWVKGASSPTYKNLQAIIEALDVSESEFYGAPPPRRRLLRQSRAAA